MPQTMVLKGELIYFAHQLDKSFKELIIIPISDLHYGNPLSSVKHFAATVDFVKQTNNVFVILNGDMIEAVTKTSLGDIYKQRGTPMEQAQWVVEKLLPIKDRILGITMGNHEERIYRDVGIDLCDYMGIQLGAPYRDSGILLKISFGDYSRFTKGKPYSYFLYATHGYGGARTKAAKAVKVERVGGWIHADCYIMSHDHVVNVSPDVYLMPDNRTHLDPITGLRKGAVIEHRKLYVKSNAFLKWGNYSEARGFPPSDLETPQIFLAGQGRKRIRVLV